MSNKENIKMYELQNFGTKNGLWKKRPEMCFRPGVRVSRGTALHKKEGLLVAVRILRRKYILFDTVTDHETHQRAHECDVRSVQPVHRVHDVTSNEEGSAEGRSSTG